MYEALTVPTAFPALGHDVSTDCRTHSVDLSAQKLSLSAPTLFRFYRLYNASTPGYVAPVLLLGNVGCTSDTVNHDSCRYWSRVTMHESVLTCGACRTGGWAAYHWSL